MRGALMLTATPTPKSRIIPADAGSTRYANPKAHPTWDHPRGCGEHPSAVRHHASGLGSSPRMRGAHRRPAGRAGFRRIIPADAGSTKRPSFRAHRARDHPRGCGEHYTSQVMDVVLSGSSPRMRGAPSWRSTRTSSSGIIPSDAGSTRSLMRAHRRGGDHPRGCG